MHTVQNSTGTAFGTAYTYSRVSDIQCSCLDHNTHSVYIYIYIYIMWLWVKKQLDLFSMSIYWLWIQNDQFSCQWDLPNGTNGQWSIVKQRKVRSLESKRNICCSKTTSEAPQQAINKPETWTSHFKQELGLPEEQHIPALYVWCMLCALNCHFW